MPVGYDEYLDPLGSLQGPQDNRPLDNLQKLDDLYGLTQDSQADPTEVALRGLDELYGVNGAPTAFGSLNPGVLLPEVRDSLAVPSPFDLATGQESMFLDSKEEGNIVSNIARFAKNAGISLLKSFNPLEKDIGLRERAFRGLNVGTLFIPFGFLSKAASLRKVFPALSALTQTRRGQVVLAGLSEGVISGGLELVRGPDAETGKSNVLTQTLLGAALGSTIGHYVGRSSAAKNARVSGVALSRFDDEIQDLASPTGPLFNGEYAIFTPGQGLPSGAQAKALEETRLALSDFGYETLTGRIGPEDAILVPALREDFAIDLARRSGAQSIITDRGLIELGTGNVFPHNVTKARFGVDIATKSTDPVLAFSTREGKAFGFQPSFNRDAPTRIGARQLPEGNPAVRYLASLIDSESPGGLARIGRAFRDMDTREITTKFYTQAVRRTHGFEILERKLGVNVEEALSHESVSKLAQMSRTRWQTTLDADIRFGMFDEDNFIEVSDSFLRKSKGPGIIKNDDIHLKQIEGTKPLGEIVENLRPNELQPFQEYGQARYFVDLADEAMRLGKDPAAFLPTGSGAGRAPLDDLRKLVDNAPTRYKETFDQVQNWRKARMQKTLVKSGILTETQFQNIWKARPNHVPLTLTKNASRILDDPNAPDIFAILDPIRRAATQGKDAPTFVPWMEEMIRQTAMHGRLAEQQRVLNKMFSQVDGATPEALAGLGLRELGEAPDAVTKGAREVLDALGKTDPVFSEFLDTMQGIDATLTSPAVSLSEGRGNVRWMQKNKDGTVTPRWFQVTDENLWSSIQGLGPTDFGNYTGIIKAASVPASILRSTVTLGLQFMQRNPFRDVFFAFVNVGANPLDAVRGFSEAIRKGHLFQAWVAGSGPRAAVVSIDAQPIRQLIDEVTGLGPQASTIQRSAKVLKNVISHPMQALVAASELLENSTRLGRFRRKFGDLVQQGLDPEKAVLEAGFLSREVSTDFSMAGASNAAAAMRSLSAFWNPSLQGLDNTVRAFARDPAGVAKRGAVLSAISASLYLTLHRDDPDYKSIPDWEKMLFWHVPLGREGVSGAAKYARFPKPFEQGILFGSMTSRFLEAVDADDPTELDDAAQEAILGQLSSMVPVPTAIEPFIENFINRNSLTGRPVIPASLEGVDSDFQINDGTSELAISLARGLNAGDRFDVSPLEVENILDSYTGPLGSFVYSTVPEALLDAYAARAHSRDPEAVSTILNQDLGDIPRKTLQTLGDAFTSTYPFSSQSVDDLFSLADKARSASLTAKTLEKSFQLDDYWQWVTEKAVLLGAETMIEGYAKQVSSIQQQRIELMSQPLISAQARRTGLDAMSRQMSDIARNAVELMKVNGIRP